MPIASQRACYFALFAAALLTGCSGNHVTPRPGASEQSPTRAAAPVISDRQTAFRVRNNFDSGLNDEGGWAAPVNQVATVVADHPFRIRFEVEAGQTSVPRVFTLQVRRNDGAWQRLPAEDFPYPLKQLAYAPGGRDRDWARDWFVIEGSREVLQRLTGASAADRLRLRTGDQPFSAWAATDFDWTPSEFSLELRLQEEPQTRFSLIFEDHGAGGYSFIELIPPDRARVIHRNGHERQMIVDAAIDVPTDQWFELKLELEGSQWMAETQDESTIQWQRSATDPGAPRLGIQLAANGMVELRALAIEGEASTPRVSIVRSPSFENGTATEDRLPLSKLPFAGGVGLSFSSRTPPWTAQGRQGEWSVPIVIRRFADGAAMNEAGDRFDFRLVGADGRPLPAETMASVTLAVADGHLGGTFVETPMRLGPWQNDSGDLYFIMEPSETWNRPMMVKSSDYGKRWREADGAGRPVTGDLEGLATAYAGGRIHVLHQVSEEVVYHAFNTSEGVDAWVVRDEPVASPPTPPTQAADLAVRSDGSIVAVYGAGEDLHYAFRSRDGSWSDEYAIAGPAGTVLSGPSVVLGRDDVVHLAYTSSDGTAWHRRIESDLSLSGAVLVANSLGTAEDDVGALLPLVTLDDRGTLVLVYRRHDGQLKERRLSDRETWSKPVTVTNRSVVQNAVDSDQVGADLVAVGNSLHVVFIEKDSGLLFHTAGQNGRWSAPQAIVSDANVQWARGQVIRTATGDRVYAVVYDAGSNGGSGRNRFLSIPLQSN